MRGDGRRQPTLPGTGPAGSASAPRGQQRQRGLEHELGPADGGESRGSGHAAQPRPQTPPSLLLAHEEFASEGGEPSKSC